MSRSFIGLHLASPDIPGLWRNDFFHALYLPTYDLHSLVGLHADAG